MSLDKGWNFRADAGFVTDGANETYMLAASDTNSGQYPITRNGMTFGWNGIIGRQDRQSGNDRRLAGINYLNDNPCNFRVDLLNAGTYVIHLALGDPDGGFSGSESVEIRDDSTLLATIDYAGNVSQRFDDATGTQLTEVTWPTTEVGVSLAFATTTFKLNFLTDIFEGGPITHLRIVEVVGRRFFLIPS